MLVLDVAVALRLTRSAVRGVRRTGRGEAACILAVHAARDLCVHRRWEIYLTTINTSRLVAARTSLVARRLY